MGEYRIYKFRVKEETSTKPMLKMLDTILSILRDAGFLYLDDLEEDD